MRILHTTSALVTPLATCSALQNSLTKSGGNLHMNR